MYLISAYFDEHVTKGLQRLIDNIAKETGNTYMIENNVPPHLTISSFETRKPDNLKEEFMKLNKIGAGEINIFSIGQFLPYVMYATPVLDEYLMHLSNEVYDIFSAREDVTINRCYKPYNWFPHITLGKKLEKEQMIMAMRVLQTHFIPIKGKIVRLGLSQTNPHKDIIQFIICITKISTFLILCDLAVCLATLYVSFSLVFALMRYLQGKVFLIRFYSPTTLSSSRAEFRLPSRLACA